MSRYSEFFLNSSSSIVELETFQISHVSFSKTYYIVRNAINGITANLETGQLVTFQYYPLAITRTGSDNDLDQTMKFSFGDLGQILPQEMDRLRRAGTVTTKPTLIYRTYRSDDLTAPIEGPYTFEIPTAARDFQQTALQAQAPRLNLNRTGETYTIDRFPMLTGFL